MTKFATGQTIRVVLKGRINGAPTTQDFLATITYLDARRAEYEGAAHKGGFALDAKHVGKMTTFGGIFPVEG